MGCVWGHILVTDGVDTVLTALQSSLLLIRETDSWHSQSHHLLNSVDAISIFTNHILFPFGAPLLILHHVLLIYELWLNRKSIYLALVK